MTLKLDNISNIRDVNVNWRLFSKPLKEEGSNCVLRRPKTFP